MRRLVSAFWLLSALASSAFATHVTVSLSEQKLYLYRDGQPVFSTKLSTGRKGMPTPMGTYEVTEKDALHTSSIYGSSMPYFMRLGGEPFGIHYGYNPGYPASHGCIRIGSMEDARYLFKVVPPGTGVTIE
jgi:lipoprotein-anchoring transpeptidase ErfK/SrfK